MRVQKIVRHESHQRQCSLPKAELAPGSLGYKGYREKRSEGTYRSSERCLRDAQWLIDGVPYCTQHAGIKALEHLADES